MNRFDVNLAGKIILSLIDGKLHDKYVTETHVEVLLLTWIIIRNLMPYMTGELKLELHMPFLIYIFSLFKACVWPGLCWFRVGDTTVQAF